MRPVETPAMAKSKPRCSSPTSADAGTRTFVKDTIPSSPPMLPNSLMTLSTFSPGDCIGTTKQLTPPLRLLFSASSVTANTKM